MRQFLPFTLMTVSCLAFERPSTVTAENESKPTSPAMDYSQLKQVQPKVVEPVRPAPPAPAATPAAATDPYGAAPSGEDCAEHKESGVAFLGVLGDPVSAPLRAQFGVNHGLVLKYVVKDSPAAKAGLQVYDIILEINGIPITDQRMLKRVISERTSRCKIELSAISKGQQQDYTLQLCDRPAKAQRQSTTPTPARENSQLSQLQRLMNEGRNLEESFTPEPSERSDTRGGFSRMFGKLMKEVAPNLNLNFESSGSVRVHDSEGSVEIHTVNDSKSAIVRDQNGNVVFEGPWNTEQDYAQASDSIKQRIDSVGTQFRNFGNKNPSSALR